MMDELLPPSLPMPEEAGFPVDVGPPENGLGDGALVPDVRIQATRAARNRAFSWRSTAAGDLPFALQLMQPFSHPSFDHLDDCIAAAVRHGITVEGLSPLTTARWGVAYRAFRRYLASIVGAERFLSGDVRTQREILEGWIGWMRTRPLTRNAIATYWRGLGALLARIATERSTLNPILLIAAPKENLPQPSFLTRERAEALLRYLDGFPARNRLEHTRNRCLFGVMLLAGLRRQEALDLGRDDVSVEAGVLRIRAGKGRNGGIPRTAYMTPQLQGLTREYLIERQRHRRTHDQLFTAIGEDRPMGLTALRRLFRRISRGLKIRVTPHMLRHTYATLLRQSGVPDRVSMELLGHRSPAMLHRYSHVLADEPAREAARLRLRVDP